MKILVTGAAGFIGFALAKHLARDHEVILLDFEERWKSEHAQYTKYSADLSDYQQLSALDQDIDVVFHIAAQSSGYFSLVHPEKDLDWNAKGTMNICKFCKENKIKKIVYSSSMAVYGNGDFLDEESRLQPISNYGVSKLAGEFYVKALQQYSTDHTILRLFNVYGPGQDMGNMIQGMVSIFLSQSLRKETIEVTGSLDRYRDCVYIDDVISALILSLEDDKTNNQTYNVGTGVPTTVKELIQMIVDQHEGKDFAVKNIGSHAGDQSGNFANSNKLMSLGWRPEVDISSGVKKFYSYEKNKVRG